MQLLLIGLALLILHLSSSFAPLKVLFGIVVFRIKAFRSLVTPLGLMACLTAKDGRVLAASSILFTVAHLSTIMIKERQFIKLFNFKYLL